MKKNIFTGKYDPLTEKDYPGLREQFLTIFMKGTYKRKSIHEDNDAHHMIGYWGTQPKVRGRFLAEEGYGGMYQPGSIHKKRYGYNDEYVEREKLIVIGRYYTKNFSFEHYRIKVLFLSGSKKGRLGFVTVG